MRYRFVAVVFGAFGVGVLGPWLFANAKSANGRYQSTSVVRLVDNGSTEKERLEGRLRVLADVLKGKLKEAGAGCTHKYDLLFQKRFKDGRRVKSESIGTITRKCGGDKRTYFLYTNNGSCRVTTNRRGDTTFRCNILTIQIDGADVGEDRTELIRGRR